MKEAKYELRDLYNDNKKLLKIKNRKTRRIISYTIFAEVIKTYFKIKFEDLFLFGGKADIRIGILSGYFVIRKKVQTRTFHVLKDNVESAKQGKLVKYKVPVLDDFYSLLMWKSFNPSFGDFRAVFSRIPNAEKKLVVKRSGWDSIKLNIKKPYVPYVKQQT